MQTRCPSPLSKKIEQCLEFAPGGLPGTTFLRQIRKDVVSFGGWDAKGDIPPIMAFSCRITRGVAYAALTSSKYREREFPVGMKSVFSDWWSAQSTHPALDVEKIAVLSCARALMSVDMVKEGDNVWKIAQRISKSMDPNQRIAAMQEAFHLARSHPGTGDRPALVAGLLAMGHSRPKSHGETLDDGWRMLLACIEDVRAAGPLLGLRHLPLDLGAPGPEFYRHLPVDSASVDMMLRMARGMLHKGVPDPVQKSEIARTMLVDLGDWVRRNKPSGRIDNPAMVKSWARASESPIFAPLEPIAMGIIMACNVDESVEPARPGPRL